VFHPARRAAAPLGYAARVLATAIAVLAAAAEHEEPSKTLYVFLGGGLAVFAVAIAAIGISRHDAFPPTEGAKRGVMALALVLTLATLASAVITA
jgi:heme/copper-type cytochrome/quinol oxidase subunit 3